MAPGPTVEDVEGESSAPRPGLRLHANPVRAVEMTQADEDDQEQRLINEGTS